MLYGIPDRLLTNKGLLFVEIFFNAVYVGLSSRLMTTTGYHFQTNMRTERKNKRIIIRHRHYISNHENDRHTFVQPLTYAYNALTHIDKHKPIKPLIDDKTADSIWNATTVWFVVALDEVVLVTGSTQHNS